MFDLNFILGELLFGEERDHRNLRRVVDLNTQQLIAAKVLYAQTATDLEHANLEISKLNSQLNLYHSLESKQYGGKEIVIEENPLFTMNKNEIKSTGSEKMKKLENERKDSIDADVNKMLPRTR